MGHYFRGYRSFFKLEEQENESEGDICDEDGNEKGFVVHFEVGLNLAENNERISDIFVNKVEFIYDCALLFRIKLKYP